MIVAETAALFIHSPYRPPLDHAVAQYAFAFKWSDAL